MNYDLKVSSNEYRNMGLDLLSKALEIDGLSHHFDEVAAELYEAADALKHLAEFLEEEPEHIYIFSEAANAIVIESFTYNGELYLWDDEECNWYMVSDYKKTLSQVPFDAYTGYERPTGFPNFMRVLAQHKKALIMRNVHTHTSRFFEIDAFGKPVSYMFFDMGADPERVWDAFEDLCQN